jgi:DNA-directed RNA polymerase subunit RPC12/RpoP
MRLNKFRHQRQTNCSMNDPLDEFIEFDATMGSDVAKCPHCGAKISRSILFDDKVKCTDCDEVFDPDE